MKPDSGPRTNATAMRNRRTVGGSTAMKVTRTDALARERTATDESGNPDTSFGRCPERGGQARWA